MTSSTGTAILPARSATDPISPAPAGGTPSTRRKPYPWHLTLQVGTAAPQGLMLKEGLIGRRVMPMANYQAPVQEEETGDLYRERSYTFRRMYLGFGDSSQQSNGPPTRYHYAKNAWTNGTYRGLGPRFRQLSFTVTPEGEVAGAVEAIHMLAGAPVTRLFVMAGRYIRRWDGDTGPLQALSLDLGAGNRAVSWARWTAGGPGQTDALYVCAQGPTLGIGHLWRYQGGQWTDLTAAGAPPAALVLNTGPELWRVCGTADHPTVPYAVSKCEADPTVPANWTSPIPVGDASLPITGLGELQMRLFIFKQAGMVWALQGGIDTGTARNITPDLRDSPNPENGKRPHAWLGSLFFRSGDSLWRFTGTEATRIGPERLVDNISPVRGPVTAFHGYGSWYGIGAVYNAARNTSYLLQYGNWIPGETASPDGGLGAFVPAWEGSQLDLEGKRVTALVVTTHASVCGVAGGTPDDGNPRLIVGFSDGSYGWLRLPRDGPSPFTEDAHLAPDDFTDQESYTRFPRHSLMAPGDLKAYLSFAATGPVLDDYRFIEVQYRVDPIGEDDPWESLFEPLTQAGGRRVFPDDTHGRTLDVRETYHAFSPPADPPAGRADLSREQLASLGSNFQALATPVVATLTLREQLRPAFRLEYAFTVLAHDRVSRRDGASDRKTAQQIRNLLVQAAQLPGHVILTMPDETVGRFALIEFQETVPPEGRFRRRGMAWELAVTCVQYRTISPYGRWFRFFGARWMDLPDGMTWAETQTL
jgi:hypothetical protein